MKLKENDIDHEDLYIKFYCERITFQFLAIEYARVYSKMIGVFIYKFVEI